MNDSKSGTDRDYYAELKINKNALDEEWMQQSEKSLYWAEQAAKSRTELSSVTLKRKILKATLGKKYRQQIKDAKEKPTDSMLEELIRTDPEYNTVTMELINAQEVFDIMDAAKWEFISRKTNLERIQEGILRNLFADPRETRPRVNEDVKDQIREDIKGRRRQ